MKWQQKTTVCFWDYLSMMIITFCGILFPDSLFGEVSEKKISSGVSTFQRIRDVEFTRFNLKTPQGEAPLRLVSPSFFSQDHQAMQPILRSNNNKKPLWFSDFADWKSWKPADLRFEGVWHPPPHAEKKNWIRFAFYFFPKGFQSSTLSKIG